MQHLSSSSAWLLAALTTLAAPGFAAEPAAAPAPALTPVAAPSAPAPAAAPAMRRCTAIIPDDQPTYAVLGKSVVIPLKARVARIVVSGQPPSNAPAAAAQPAQAQIGRAHV